MLFPILLIAFRFLSTIRFRDGALFGHIRMTTKTKTSFNINGSKNNKKTGHNNENDDATKQTPTQYLRPMKLTQNKYHYQHENHRGNNTGGGHNTNGNHE